MTKKSIDQLLAVALYMSGQSRRGKRPTLKGIADNFNKSKTWAQEKRAMVLAQGLMEETIENNPS